MRVWRGGSAIALLAATISLAYASSEERESRHEKFVPLVAFRCGYRNRYMSENGSWQSDDNKYATCVSGKLDILKYCKKSYPSLNVTNIVEYAHEVTVADWCREEGDACHFEHTVRPFRCIVGEFHSEALQVPHDCRFNHENSVDTCNDYSHWKGEASRLCKLRSGSNGKSMSVRSFAMLEPCGLDMFTGVEFVCCPASAEEKVTPATIVKKAEKEKKESSATKESEDDDDYDEEYDDEDDSEDEDEKSSDSLPRDRDVYFSERAKDLATEHENFRAAMERLEMRHRAKINKVMKEWGELDKRYETMKKNDPKGADKFKKEMTNRFQSTVASLEDENRKAKKEVEEVHEERVLSAMNEKKRQATHLYRQALALSVGAPNKHNVLKALKTYIRAEEKDRIHTLNRYRHLLRTDIQEAFDFRPVFIHRLRYIDLRINGTMAMLRDFPDLEAQVRPIATAFWHDFRKENTPELDYEQLRSMEHLPAEDLNTKLLSIYEEDFRKNHPNAFLHVKVAPHPAKIAVDPTQAPATTKAPSVDKDARVLPADDSEDSDSEEDNDPYYEDENDEEVKKQVVAVDKGNSEKPAVKVIKAELASRPIVEPAPTEKPEATEWKDEKDESTQTDDDSSDESSESDERDIAKELKVDIEPIIDDKSVQLPTIPGYRYEHLVHKTDGSWPFSAFGYIVIFAGIVLTAILAFLIVGMRNRRRHIRFVEVDVCSPEERHVNGMQVNGYENPTYSFFDSKA